MSISRYDAYFESLGARLSLSQSPPTNVIDIDITKTDGYVVFKFTISTGTMDLPNFVGKPILRLWSDWNINAPIKFGIDTMPLSVENLSCSDGCHIDVVYFNKSTYFILREAVIVRKIEIEFACINAIIPLSESTPYNRYVFHLNVQLNKKMDQGLLIKIIRYPEVVTRFTKGNYSLSFPSRPMKEVIVTNIYFSRQKMYLLKLGIANGDIKQLTKSWNEFLQLGLVLVLVSFLLSFGQSPALEFVTSTAALLVSLLQEVPEYFYVTRRRYYTGKGDINHFAAITSIMSILFNITLVLAYYSGYFTAIIPTIVIAQGVISLIAALIGFLLLRVGFLENYMCDIINCTSRLPFRYSSWNCFVTGRVLCRKCVKEYCFRCPIYRDSGCRLDEMQHRDLSELPCTTLEGAMR